MNKLHFIIDIDIATLMFGSSLTFEVSMGLKVCFAAFEFLLFQMKVIKG